MMRTENNEVWLVTISAPFSGEELIREAPLALMYLSGALKDKGFLTRILDLLEEDVEGFLEELRSSEPLFIGISSGYGIWAELTTTLARRIKSLKPHIPILAGGINVTCSPGPYLRESCYDYLALGEGEATIQEFACALEESRPVEGIPGLAYRRNGTDVFTDGRPLEKDIDRFRIDFEGIDLNPYIETLPDSTRVLKPYQASRGCPFNCSFCYNSSYNKRRWRRHSLEYILNDIRYLKSKYSFDALQFADDHFFVDRKWAFEIMGALHGMGIVFNTICARVQDLDEDFFDHLMEYGCRAVLVGYESENPRVLKLMNKEAPEGGMEKGLEIAARYPGIRIYGLVILGVPTHTFPEMAASVRYAVNLLERFPNFECSIVGYTPITGSGFYPMVVEKGFKGYDTMQDFSRMGWGKKHNFEYTFDMEWLDLTEEQKNTIRKVPRLSHYFDQTLAARRTFTGVVRLVNEIFYQGARYRLTTLRTSFLYEDLVYGFFVRVYRLLQKKGIVRG
jgi:radical SAM superfamily enzyme YgiQ (UPF0313 family)